MSFVARPQLVTVPKPSGTGSRRLVRLAPPDGLRFARVVEAAAEATDAAQVSGVFSNRLRLGRPEPWRIGRRRFRRALQAASVAFPVAMLTDVRECFASIPPSTVEAALRAAGCERVARARVRRELENFAAAGVAGLPAGPAPSGVLANAVLASVDASVPARVRLLRWVDDYIVLARDERDAQEAFRRIGDALRALGLRTAPEKTRVVASGDIILARQGGWSGDDALSTIRTT